MGRVPPTFKSRTVLVPHPDWPGERIERARRGEIVPACHDGTPHAEVRCTCGSVMHLHLSQFDPIPSGLTVAAPCHGCQHVFEFDRDETVRSLREAWGWEEKAR
jgi:hypothetical protein